MKSSHKLAIIVAVPGVILLALACFKFLEAAAAGASLLALGIAVIFSTLLVWLALATFYSRGTQRSVMGVGVARPQVPNPQPEPPTGPRPPRAYVLACSGEQFEQFRTAVLRCSNTPKRYWIPLVRSPQFMLRSISDELYVLPAALTTEVRASIFVRWEGPWYKISEGQLDGSEPMEFIAKHRLNPNPE